MQVSGIYFPMLVSKTIGWTFLRIAVIALEIKLQHVHFETFRVTNGVLSGQFRDKMLSIVIESPMNVSA